MQGNWGLIDKDTPEWAKTRKSTRDGTPEMELIFSDEFNTDGRSFYPGMCATPISRLGRVFTCVQVMIPIGRSV
jgi:hypothetical protein